MRLCGKHGEKKKRDRTYRVWVHKLEWGTREWVWPVETNLGLNLNLALSVDPKPSCLICSSFVNVYSTNILKHWNYKSEWYIYFLKVLSSLKEEAGLGCFGQIGYSLM